VVVRPTELLSVLPGALALTAGVDHVVESLSPRGAQLLGSAVRLGHALRETLPAGELVAALDAAYRGDGTTVVPRGVMSSVTDEAVSGLDFGLSCSPVGDGRRRVSGLLLCVLTDGPVDDELSWSRAREFQRLTEQLSRPTTPAEIGRLAATSAATLVGADACTIYIRGEGAQVVESLHHAGWVGDWVERFHRLPLQRGRPLSDAVLTGRPVWLEDAEQWRSRYPEMAPAGLSDGHQATACLPLRVEERDLGAAVFRFRRPRVFGSGEREFLLAVAALCAQALDRARLYAAETEARSTAERERDRMTFLAQASQLMEAPLSVEERLQRLADFAVSGIADWAAVHLVRGEQVEQIAVAHLDPEKITFVEQLERRYPPDPDAAEGAVQVARSGEPLVMTDVPDELLVASAVDATHLELIRALGLRSAIVVPLLVRGRSLGALTLVHAESGRRFTSDDLPFVGQLARSAAFALDNAALYERQRTVAHTLQTALLPGELPDIPGLECAGRYRPPSPEVTDVYVGGDLYDVCEDDERGRWTLTVADVCGKGPQAAALTALIRHTVHAEVGHGLGPSEVLRRVNAAMRRHNGPDRSRFATMVHAEMTVDPAGAALRLVSGGHPPGLVLRGDWVEPVDTPGTLVGVYPQLRLIEVELRLAPGDALLLYTDGVTEARGPLGFYGSERLEALLASLAGEPADAIADGILAEVSAFQDGRLRDDVALLVVAAQR
jgi:GAF domain-containing protein